MRTMKPKMLPLICSIGSLDPTGAAGILRDFQVYTLLRAAGVAVTAAVTAQNDKRVSAVAPLPGDVVTKQLEATWEQGQPDAVCIGLLPDVAAIRAVGNFLRKLGARQPVVLDPVLAASNGHVFLRAREIRELVTLLPLATVVTPNLDEAGKLAGLRVFGISDAEKVALRLARHGCAALVTGGHLAGNRCVDVLARGDRARRFAGSKLRGSMRGTGGILAAAIAVDLARGVGLDHAVANARRFLRRMWRRDFRLPAPRRSGSSIGRRT